MAKGKWEVKEGKEVEEGKDKGQRVEIGNWKSGLLW
jgi:hypothetical protein